MVQVKLEAQVVKLEAQVIKLVLPQFRWDDHVFEKLDKDVRIEASVKLGEDDLVQQIPKALAFVCRLKIEIVPVILIVSFEIAHGPEMGVLEFALLRFRSVQHAFKETVWLVPA